METRVDPRLERSRAALIAEINRIIDAGSLDHITITDIVKGAGLSRPTFYQHFGDLPTLIRDAALTRLNAALTTIRQDVRSNTDDDEEVIHQRMWHSLLSHLHDNAAFYRTSLAFSGAVGFIPSVVEFVAEQLGNYSSGLLSSTSRDSVLHADATSLSAGGITWIIVNWLYSDFKGENSVTKMAQRITRLLSETPATQ